MTLTDYDFALSGVVRDVVVLPTNINADVTLPERCVGFRVGGAGDLVLTTIAGGADKTIAGVGAGEYVPIAATHVKAATTATAIVALIA